VLLPIGTRSAVGSTIVQRIRISRFGGANGRCSGFEVRRRCRSSAQFMPRRTTNSIRSAISSRGKSTSRDALLPWPSGALSRHRSPLARWRLRCTPTSLRYFDAAGTRSPAGRVHATGNDFLGLSRRRSSACAREIRLLIQCSLSLRSNKRRHDFGLFRSGSRTPKPHHSAKRITFIGMRNWARVGHPI
jgi:hypothetical protein